MTADKAESGLGGVFVRRGVVYAVCAILVFGAAVVQLVHWAPPPDTPATAPGEPVAPPDPPPKDDYPAWVVTQQFALALAAGIVASLIYSQWYGRIAESEVVGQVVQRVSRDATEEMQRILGERLDLLPSNVFRTKDDTKGELDLSYARYLNSRIVNSTSVRFRGENGRIAIYRLGELASRFQKDDVELHFLLLNPWRPGHTPSGEQVLDLLTSIFGLWKLSTTQKVSDATVSLFDGPLTYRGELTDSACILSYFEEVGEDSVYYAYEAGTPTYNALRRWFFAEVGYAVTLRQAITVTGNPDFSAACLPLRSSDLIPAFDTALKSADLKVLDERLRARAEGLQTQRESIVAM